MVFDEFSLYWTCLRNFFDDHGMHAFRYGRYPQDARYVACATGPPTVSGTSGWSHWLHWQRGTLVRSALVKQRPQSRLLARRIFETIKTAIVCSLGQNKDRPALRQKMVLGCATNQTFDTTETPQERAQRERQESAERDRGRVGKKLTDRLLLLLKGGEKISRL